MLRYLIVILALCSQVKAHAESWFEDSSPLINAHQMLLENRISDSFASMVQVWQSRHDPYMESHLNDLLLKALERDCGKSLSNESLPQWLNEVTIRRQSVQSPGRISQRLVIDILADKKLNRVNFVKWPEVAISRDTESSWIKEDNKTIQRNVFILNQRLPKGLYQLTLKTEDSQEWRSWVLMGEAQAKEIVRWETHDSWEVDKFGLLNPYCELPVMDVSLYDYVDDQYKRIWHRDYESRYPEKLPRASYKPDRYVLAVSITHKRWQGQIMIEEQQAISKTYDISEE
ncbi:DUF2861 family protein [Vibrio sp. JC009]|uniref:DUF2861 family protein n=1 Tax=Vibrio sp. JC009 TaxID=2912314 RepID=UPI0023AF59CC|nr:DUF2861 family protein [Vibrio sp. JC009]WED24373.1 DUF2861 family protein [Vibrio sp. JC009]